MTELNLEPANPTVKALLPIVFGLLGLGGGILASVIAGDQKAAVVVVGGRSC